MVPGSPSLLSPSLQSSFTAQRSSPRHGSAFSRCSALPLPSALAVHNTAIVGKSVVYHSSTRQQMSNWLKSAVFLGVSILFIGAPSPRACNILPSSLSGAAVLWECQCSTHCSL